jgi:hypothetical protein
MPELRRTLRDAGINPDLLTDDEVRDEMRRLLDRVVPAPAVPASSRPVNGRVWLSDAVTSGGFQQPENPHQLANLGDGGPPVELAVLGLLVMRHLSGSREHAAGWTDEALSRRVGIPLDDIRRGQKLLDDVAALVGREATSAARWWKR